MSTDDKPALFKVAIAKLVEETLMTVGEPKPFSVSDFCTTDTPAPEPEMFPAQQCRNKIWERENPWDEPFHGYYLRPPVRLREDVK